LDTSESRSEISEKFCNVVLDKDREDELDRTFEKRRRVKKSQKGKECAAKNKKKEG